METADMIFCLYIGAIIGMIIATIIPIVLTHCRL